ncbi:MAG: putative quinol monooxygenase [Alphaproteobacteria bacterium]
MNSRFVVLVEFTLASPEFMTPFRVLIDDNARQSRALEPGCQCFDVLNPKGAHDRIVLYEVYDDRQAFQAHLGSEHYQVFETECAHLVKSKSVSEMVLVCDGREQDGGEQ